MVDDGGLAAENMGPSFEGLIGFRGNKDVKKSCMVPRCRDGIACGAAGTFGKIKSEKYYKKKSRGPGEPLVKRIPGADFSSSNRFRG